MCPSVRFFTAVVLWDILDKNTPEVLHVQKSDFPRWLILYVLAILVVAGVIDLFMYLAIPTAPGLNAPTWLTFWGSYLGGAIGCLPLWRPSTITARRHASSTRKPKRTADLL